MKSLCLFMLLSIASIQSKGDELYTSSIFVNDSGPQITALNKGLGRNGSKSKPWVVSDQGLTFVCVDGFLYFYGRLNSLTPYLSNSEYRQGSFTTCDSGKAF